MLLLPGEIRPPPPAKVLEKGASDYSGNIRIVSLNVAKNREEHKLHPLRIFLAFVTLVLIIVTLVCLETNMLPTFKRDSAKAMPLRIENQSFRKIPKVFDSLDDLKVVHKAFGVEPDKDFECLICFFNDTGRVRPSSSTNKAFMSYQVNSQKAIFEVITHILLQELSTYPEYVEPKQQFSPFSFYKFPLDEEEWSPLQPTYEKLGSAMGWEKGVFRGSLENSKFFKIDFNQPKGYQTPRIGEVEIYDYIPGEAQDVLLL